MSCDVFERPERWHRLKTTTWKEDRVLLRIMMGNRFLSASRIRVGWSGELDAVSLSYTIERRFAMARYRSGHPQSDAPDWLLIIDCFITIPDSNVHGANMGPIWGRQDPGGPHVGPMNFAMWDCTLKMSGSNSEYFQVLAVLEVVSTTAPSATNDYKVVTMTTFLFPCGIYWR